MPEPPDEPTSRALPAPDSSMTEQVYDELRRVAEIRLQAGPRSSSLQATMLVDEAWLHLRETPAFDAKDQAHYLAAAAQAMRWIVVDRARKRKAARLGTLMGEQVEPSVAGQDDRVLALSEAMERLRVSCPAEAEVAELRYFTGLSIDDTADLVGTSAETVKRRWAFARAWLTNDLQTQDSREN